MALAQDYDSANAIIVGVTTLITLQYTKEAADTLTADTVIDLQSNDPNVLCEPANDTKMTVGNTVATRAFRVTAKVKGDITLTPNISGTGVTIGTQPASFQYKEVLDGNDIYPPAFAPLVTSSNFIYDLNPFDGTPGKTPTLATPFISIYFSTLKLDGSTLPHYRIPLTIQGSDVAHLKVYKHDSGFVEYIPTDNVYYIDMDDSGSATIRLYPVAGGDGLITTTPLVDLGIELLNASSDLLFVTKAISWGGNAPPPGIEELDGNRLSPMPGALNFNVNIPAYGNAKAGDKIYVMNTYTVPGPGFNFATDLCAVARVDSDTLFGTPFVRVPYSSIANAGDNNLFYFAYDGGTNPVKSTELYFVLTDKPPVTPPTVQRTLDAPKLRDGNGVEIPQETGIVNQKTIQTDLSCVLPVGNGGDAKLSLGDSVTVNIYVAGCYGEDHSPHNLGKAIASVTIAPADVTAGEHVVPVPRNLLTNFDSFPDGTLGTLKFEYVTSSNKYSYLWNGHIDTVPPGI